MLKRFRALSTPKKIVVSTLIAVVIIGGLWGLDKVNVIDVPLIGSKEVKQTEGQDEINYGPPTEEEKDETERFKEGLGSQNQNNSTQQNTPAGQKKSVSVFITSWGQPQSDAEVSGYVTGVYEEGGTCTATMEKGGQKVTASGGATLNAQNISCGFISVPRSQLSAGTWNMTLSYSSASAEGSSQPVTLEVK